MENIKKREWLLPIINFVIDNLSAIVTLGFATYVIYRQEFSQFSFSTNDLLTAILGVLGLLTVSEIIERYRKLHKIEKTTDLIAAAIQSRVGEQPPASLFFLPEKLKLTDDIRKSKTMYMCGINLASILESEYFEIFNSLREKATLKLLLVEPESPAFYSAINKGQEPIDKEVQSSRLLAAYKNIESLQKLLRENREKFPNQTGILEVRMISSYSPSFGLLIFDPEKAHGKVVVIIHPHKSGYKMNPRFVLTPNRDGDWYKYFVSQFDEMWQYMVDKTL
jgi:hypothetical protein